MYLSVRFTTLLTLQAEVARESVLRVAPDIDIIAYHASVFEERFGVSWVKTFDIVLNALDNIKVPNLRVYSSTLSP